MWNMWNVKPHILTGASDIIAIFSHQNLLKLCFTVIHHMQSFLDRRCFRAALLCCVRLADGQIRVSSAGLVQFARHWSDAFNVAPYVRNNGNRLLRTQAILECKDPETEGVYCWRFSMPLWTFWGWLLVASLGWVSAVQLLHISIRHRMASMLCKVLLSPSQHMEHMHRLRRRMPLLESVHRQHLCQRPPKSLP